MTARPDGSVHVTPTGSQLVLCDVATEVHETEDSAVIDLTDDVVRIDLSAGEVIDLTEPNPYARGYFRTPEQCADLERRIIELIDPAIIPDSGLVQVMIEGASPLADFNRTLEMSQGWLDMPTYMHGYEHATLAIALVDFDRERPAITNGGRIVLGRLTAPYSSGSQVIDALGDRIDPQAVGAELGADLRTCMDGTTFIAVRGLPRSPKFPFGYGLLNFVGFTRLMLAENAPWGFAYVNQESLDFFTKVGLRYQLILGEELQAPLVDGHQYNADFHAVVLPQETFLRSFLSDDHPLAAVVEPYRKMALPQLMVRSPSRRA
jgi:hypothetical protein